MKKKLDPDEMPGWLASVALLRPHYVLAGIDDDDCAVLRWGDDLLIATTDYLNSRPIAIELGIGSLRDLGRLNVLANLADLCGSGAEPRAFLSAITMPREATESDFKDVFEGVLFEASRWKVPVVGGDTKLGPALAILGVALGAAHTTKNLFLKNRAMAGDLIWLSGEVGSCSAAVVQLSGLGSATDAALAEWSRLAILEPNLPMDRSREISRAELGHGGIDISDGLGNDLHRLARASNVGMIVYAPRIPIAKEVRIIAQALNVPAWTFAFGVGGDMQFVISSAPSNSSMMESFGLTCIGEIVEGRSLLLKTDQVAVPLPSGGHRDGRRVSFAEETRNLVLNVSKEAAGGGNPYHEDK